MRETSRAVDKKPQVNNTSEYQIEMLHKYGDEHPESGLKLKVKGFQFSQKIDILDPITHLKESKPMKPFMVNQLTMCIEREQLILSPFDETLHKQLVDYEVVRQGANGNPVFTDKNEHFVDALGLAFLAFVLEMPNLTRTIQEVDFTAELISGESPILASAEKRMNRMRYNNGQNPWKDLKNGSISFEDAHDRSDGDQPTVFQVSPSYFKRGQNFANNWGSRFSRYSGRNSGGRRMF